MLLTLGMLQGESWTEGASKLVGVVPTRWEAGALGWAIGSEGSEHEDAAGFDRLGGRRHVVIPISWLDKEVEDGSVVNYEDVRIGLLPNWLASKRV